MPHNSEENSEKGAGDMGRAYTTACIFTLGLGPTECHNAPAVGNVIAPLSTCDGSAPTHSPELHTQTEMYVC